MTILHSNYMLKLIVDKKYFVCYCKHDNLIKVSLLNKNKFIKYLLNKGILEILV